MLKWCRGYSSPAARLRGEMFIRSLGEVDWGNWSAEATCTSLKNWGALGAGARGWRRGAKAQATDGPSNNALHPTAGRGALLLRARRCSAPAAGERGR